MRRILLFAVCLALVAFQLNAATNRVCLPVAMGVPGPVLFDQPPNWWLSSAGQPLFNTALDAPNWRGASGVTFPSSSGATEHVLFRGLQKTVGATQYLYLSWWGKAVPDVTSGSNALWVGFRGNGAGDDAVAFEIRLTNAADSTAGVFPGRATVTQWTHAGAAGPWLSTPGATIDWLNGSDPNGTNPAVEDATGRVWLSNGGGFWAIQMRVPLTTSTNIDNGIRVTSPFKMWYEFQAGTPDLVTFPNGYVAYTWPRGTTPILFEPAPVADFGETRLTSGTPESPDPNCPADGVSLRADRIMTTNADPHSINLLTANTFRAQPFNGMATPVTLTATFRTGNWGVAPVWENVPTPNATLWKTLTVSTPTLITPGVFGTIDANYTVAAEPPLSADCVRCQYAVFFNANGGICAGCGATNNTRRTHQCTLVELTASGPGPVDFLNMSAYRNMNFANTSEYTEATDVTVEELPETSPGSRARTVYFYIQATNMPAKTGGGGEPTPTPAQSDTNRSEAFVQRPQVPPYADPNVPRDERRKIITAMLDQGATSFGELQQVLPTFIVHAYYDTGMRSTRGAKTFAVLAPLTSFGYFPMHDGVPEGWRYGLNDAEQLSPEWYRLAVGPSGRATIRPYIEAIEPGQRGRWRAFIDAGINFPDGSLEGGFSINGGIERRFTNNWSLEGILGYHRFDGVFQDRPFDVDAWQLSLNGKYFFGTGKLRPFMNGGVGAYRIDPPDDVEFGMNAGAGLLYEINSKWGVEGVYNYHTTDPLDWSTLQLGLRWHF